MTTFLQDSFTATNGTSLVGHTAEVGGTWAAHPSYPSSGATIQSGRVVPGSGAGDQVFIPAGTASTADVTVSADLVFTSDPTVAGVTLCHDPTADAFYVFGRVLGNWAIYKHFVGGAGSGPVGSPNGAPSVTSGQTYPIEFSRVGSTLTGKVNGTVVVTATDTTLTGAGRAGLHFQGTGVAIDNIVAVDATMVVPDGIEVPLSSIRFSPSVWNAGKTVNAGARFKAQFTGTANATLTFDVSGFVGASVSSGLYPKIKYRLNGSSWTVAQLTSAGVVVISGLTPATGYTLEVVFMASSESLNRWDVPLNALTLTSLTVDADAAYSLPAAATPYSLFLGDSITEGVGAIGTPGAISGTDGYLSFAAVMGRALGGDYAQVGFGGQGWANTGSGGVPALPSAWKFLWADQARSFTTQPLRAFVNMGTNGSTSQSVVAAFITDFLSTLSTTKLYLILPFNGAGRAAIEAAVTAAASSRVKLLSSAADNYASIQSAGMSDSLHPNAAGAAVAAGLLLDELEALEAPAGTAALTTEQAAAIALIPSLLTALTSLSAQVDGITTGDPSEWETIKAKVFGLGMPVVLSTSVVPHDTVLREVYRGLDYYIADGRALQWEVQGEAARDLVASIVSAEFVITDSGLTGITAAVTATADSALIKVQLSRTQTAALPGPRHDCRVQATLASGHVVGLVTGRLAIR